MGECIIAEFCTQTATWRFSLRSHSGAVGKRIICHPVVKIHHGMGPRAGISVNLFKSCPFVTLGVFNFEKETSCFPYLTYFRLHQSLKIFFIAMFQWTIHRPLFGNQCNRLCCLFAEHLFEIFERFLLHYNFLLLFMTCNNIYQSIIVIWTIFFSHLFILVFFSLLQFQSILEHCVCWQNACIEI